MWWVGLHPLYEHKTIVLWYEVHRRQVLNECWPASAMEEIHVEDNYILTCVLGSFFNYIRDFTNKQSLIIFRTFRILAHEEDQYTVMFRKYKAIFCL